MITYCLKSTITVLRRSFDFSGRLSRREFWSSFAVFLTTGILFGATDLAMGTYSREDGLGPLMTVYGLATLLPFYAAAARRLHDAGSSGWLSLIGLVPIAGTFVLLVLLGRPGEPGPNRFGDSPDAVLPGVP